MGEAMRGKTALISVFHKTGIVEFAKALVALGWDILASGGTARVLSEAGIAVRDVATLVGGNAILEHRVVTLSRKVHAGLLADYNKPAQMHEMELFEIPVIDLVCVDLYPLEEEIAKSGATREDVIEKTDVGGPTMLRSAAKGRRIVIADPADRTRVIEWLQAGKPDEDSFVTALVAKAEFVVAKYCLASARYHSAGGYDGLLGRRVQTCLYGENGYQVPAALFSADSGDPLALENLFLCTDTLPSFNNLCDLDRLLHTTTHIAAGDEVNFGKVRKIAVVVKHGNACGAAIGEDEYDVLRRMVRGDLRAITGGVVMTNFSIDEKGAEILLADGMSEGVRRLLDTIAAPEITEAAIEMLRRKKDKCRILVNPALSSLEVESIDTAPIIRPVRGGFLMQPNYTFILNLADPDLKKISEASPKEEQDLVFAWAIEATSTSNTITIVRDGTLLGNGVGRQDRVGAAELAIKIARDAGHEVEGSVAASDSFFPFRDGPNVLMDAGVRTIFASSGSVRDGEVKAACEENGVSLYLIPDKKGRGFFNH